MRSTACALNTLQLTVATFLLACIPMRSLSHLHFICCKFFATNKEIGECVLCKHGGDDGDDDDNNNNIKN